MSQRAPHPAFGIYATLSPGLFEAVAAGPWKTEIVLRRSKIFIATGIQIAVAP
jgi:hypothetical protein